MFDINRATAAKWLKRDDVQDRSHRAHTLHTTLSSAQEASVLSLRQTLDLPLDDLLYITRQYINADVSRSGITHLLKREGMGDAPLARIWFQNLERAKLWFPSEIMRGELT